MSVVESLKYDRGTSTGVLLQRRYMLHSHDTKVGENKQKEDKNGGEKKQTYCYYN